MKCNRPTVRGSGMATAFALLVLNLLSVPGLLVRPEPVWGFTLVPPPPPPPSRPPSGSDAPSEPPPPPPTLTLRVPGVQATVPIFLVDPVTQRGVGQALGQLFKSLNPDPDVVQAFDSGILTVQLLEGTRFGLLPLGVRSASPFRRTATPSVTLDSLTGVATLTTAAGTQVEVMGSPPDFASFLGLLDPFGVRSLRIERGQFILQIGNPSLTGIIRLDFKVVPGAGPPGFRVQPDGSGQLVYPPGVGARIQSAVPVFADIPGLLQVLAAQPGGSDAQPIADGTVQATLNGRCVRLRPDFTVRASPAGSKRVFLDDAGGPVFDLGDGRRQRFSILP